MGPTTHNEIKSGMTVFGMNHTRTYNRYFYFTTTFLRSDGWFRLSKSTENQYRESKYKKGKQFVRIKTANTPEGRVKNSNQNSDLDNVNIKGNHFLLLI